MLLVSPAIGSFRLLHYCSPSSSFPSQHCQGERRRRTTTRLIVKSGDRTEMEMWVFGYGSLIWKAGFNYDDRLVGFVKGYRRVFYQGSTDHRGTPEFPGRTVTLEPAHGDICWGVAYKISSKEDRDSALDHLEVREKQYDEKAYLDFFTDPAATAPAISGVMVYIGSADKERNQNYLGSAPLEDIAKQIARAQGPSGPNTEYLFKLEAALLHIGCKDKHVMDLASKVRDILSETQ